MIVTFVAGFSVAWPRQLHALTIHGLGAGCASVRVVWSGLRSCAFIETALD